MLSIRGLYAGYGEVDIVQDVSLELGDGEVAAVVGANGAGKSTLVRTLTGLLPQTAGQIELAGNRLDALPAHARVRQGLAAVLEGRHLFGDLSVKDTLRLASAMGRRLERSSSIPFTVEDAHRLFPVLAEKSAASVGVLSGGEQQMVAIAKSLLLQPKVLVLDEPSTGLAPRLLDDILKVLVHLRDRGMSMLLIEQSVWVASEVTERAYVMELGKVVASGTWSSLASEDLVARAYLGT